MSGKAKKVFAVLSLVWIYGVFFCYLVFAVLSKMGIQWNS